MAVGFRLPLERSWQIRYASRMGISQSRKWVSPTLFIFGMMVAFAQPIHAKGSQIPLIEAASKGDAAEVKEQIDRGVDVNICNIDGRTALIYAAWKGHVEVAKLLLIKGASVNYQCRSHPNYTALMCAVFSGHHEMVKLLLDNGADPNLKETMHGTALSFAIREKNDEIVKLLRSVWVDDFCTSTKFPPGTKSTVGAEQPIIIGKKTTIITTSPKAVFSASFEGAEEGGALVVHEKGQKGEHDPYFQIYRVGWIIDREKPVNIKIMWSSDGLKCALLANDYPQALYDFSKRRGYCRSAWGTDNEDPTWPKDNWILRLPEWRDSALELFK